MIIRPEIHDLCQAFVLGLNRVLGDQLLGVYLYGAVAFSNTDPIGDIDFHVIIKEGLSNHQCDLIKQLHEQIASDFPLLGAELDGYYLLLNDAMLPAPPPDQLHPSLFDDSWALHREHIRSGRCIILYGPDPKQIYPTATWRELDEALAGELDYVEKNLDTYPDYCILNLCRLMYSFQTRDVVISKAMAARWAEENYPEFSRHIQIAQNSYARRATNDDLQFIKSQVNAFCQFACTRIDEARSLSSSGS